MALPTFELGDISIAPALMLAPMSGITGSAFRRAVKARNPGAIGLLISEFISVEGLTRDNVRSHQMLDYDDSERPISIQIFGSDVDRLVAAAEIVAQRGADVVDINAGCPVPKVVKRGGGAELMRQCDRLEHILRSVVAAVDIPVTLKTRIGWDADSINIVELAKRVEGCGISMLAVHGRTRVAAYSGDADWEVLDAVARSVSIPVIGSGDVRTPEDAAHRLSSTAVAGLMIGRGAMANPWIFRACAEHFAGRPWSPPTVAERVAFLADYAEGLRQTLPATAVAPRVKRIASQITKGMPGGGALRRAIYESGAVETILDVIARYPIAEEEAA